MRTFQGSASKHGLGGLDFCVYYSISVSGPIPVSLASSASGTTCGGQDIDPVEVAVNTIKGYWGLNPEDVITINGALVQNPIAPTPIPPESSSATPVPAPSAPAGPETITDSLAGWIPPAIQDWIPASVEKKGSGFVIVFVLGILYLLFGRK